ncbi:MAG TPA: hypothetical protein VIV63_07045, partial [Steroidobacteraceae bacterium]
RDGLHLYTTNPDGTDTQLHYGAVSHMTGTQVAGVNTAVEFMRAREMSDGRLMVLTRQRTNVDFGGNLTIIDANRFVENTQTTLAAAGSPGPAQTPATLNDVRTVPGPSPGGRFTSGFPLWDGSGRILVSWTQCRLLDDVDPTRIVPCTTDRLAAPNVQTAPPLYSIWMFTPSQNTILPIMPPVEGVMVTEAVAAQPRTPLPAVIVDKQPPFLDADLVAEGTGLLSIRSVYDIMGSTGTVSIPSISNPTNPGPYNARLVRFIRIEKPVSIPDDDDSADPDNAAFGPTGVMREIVAYAPVEPDGSVRMKVPANIAFQISLLDANGRRVNNVNGSDNRHRSWLTVRPGEVLECNGCHTRNNATPMVHGRKDLFTAAYNGGSAGPFPGTVTSISAESGDTMARARSRPTSSCPDSTLAERPAACGLQSITPSADVVFEEIWAPGALPATSFAWSHQDLATARPTNASCYPVWTPTCRITIHYQTIGARPGHIMPLWTVDRVPADPLGIDTNGDGILEPTYKCTSCHDRVSVVAAVQLPAASLELLPGTACNAQNLYDNTYCQLLRPRDELVLDVGGNVVTAQSLIPLDANGQPTSIVPLITAPMTATNARGSRFFNVMNTAPHQGMLTPAELRLLSEWLDIGAQYYNDPFPPTPE